VLDIEQARNTLSELNSLPESLFPSQEKRDFSLFSPVYLDSDEFSTARKDQPPKEAADRFTAVDSSSNWF
jgi:hypothetical protein